MSTRFYYQNQQQSPLEATADVYVLYYLRHYSLAVQCANDRTFRRLKHRNRSKTVATLHDADESFLLHGML